MVGQVGFRGNSLSGAKKKREKGERRVKEKKIEKEREREGEEVKNVIDRVVEASEWKGRGGDEEGV
jgi:hypothetical protein